MIKLTQRQKKIVDFISREAEVGMTEIQGFLEESGVETSRFSVVRDLATLLQNDLISRTGRGPSTKYAVKWLHPHHQYVDMDDYFKTPQEERKLASRSFEFEIFEKLDRVLTADDLEKLGALNVQFRENIKNISPTIKKLEMERFTIELAWKSSQIEGNTYSLLDTEDLIKNQIQAPGHTKEEAVMILNHKAALDFINSNVEYFHVVSLKKLEELHRLIAGGLNIRYNIRKSPVGITGTNYRPLDNEYQIKEAVEKMIAMINSGQHPLFKAFIALTLISYIQPFEDGNKRTARLLANALLVAYDFCPLSYRNVKESEYKKAMLIFYESHNADPLKRMFMDQFTFAVQNYFRA